MNLTGVRTHQEQAKMFPTGFGCIYCALGEIRGGEVTLVHARNAISSADFCMQICLNLVMDSNASLMVFSMSEPKEKIVRRMDASLGRLPLRNLKSGALSSAEFQKQFEVHKALKNANMCVSDGCFDVWEIADECRRVNREMPIDVVVVHGFSGTSIQPLQMLARELGCAVLVHAFFSLRNSRHAHNVLSLGAVSKIVSADGIQSVLPVTVEKCVRGSKDSFQLGYEPAFCRVGNLAALDDSVLPPVSQSNVDYAFVAKLFARKTRALLRSDEGKSLDDFARFEGVVLNVQKCINGEYPAGITWRVIEAAMAESVIADNDTLSNALVEMAYDFLAHKSLLGVPGPWCKVSQFFVGTDLSNTNAAKLAKICDCFG